MSLFSPSAHHESDTDLGIVHTECRVTVTLLFEFGVIGGGLAKDFKRLMSDFDQRKAKT